MSEAAHQEALVSWARLPLNIARYPGLELLHSSLNGVKLSKAQAGKAKAAGMLAGVYDLWLPVRRGPFAGMIIEMKYGRNKLTEQQEWFGGLMREQGWRVETAYDWLTARNLIIEFLMQHDLFADSGAICRGCGGSLSAPLTEKATSSDNMKAAEAISRAHSGSKPRP